MPSGAVALRRAEPGDAPAIGAIWWRAWQDGHLGHVPEALVAVRTADSFLRRAQAMVADTVVAEYDGTLAGFVRVAGDEVEQVFVDRPARGTGVATALLAEGERLVREAGHQEAWLAVVAGNARARRFYERCGWVDDGPFDYAARTEDGTIPVPCRRYVKRLT